jgi:hypothetical protein
VSQIDIALGVNSLRRGGSDAIFSPASLFANSEIGVWYDPSDLATLFQDSAGLVPAIVDQPVGKMLDKSGGGRHASQATTASKPVLRLDESDNFYLEFDGVDDYLRVNFNLTLPWDRVSAIRQISWNSSGILLGGGQDYAGYLFQTFVSPRIQMNDGSAGATSLELLVGENGIVTERHDGVNSNLAVNTGTYAVKDAGPYTPGGITIASDNTNSSYGNIRFYGTIMIDRALNGPEIDGARNFLASKSGVTLLP